MKIKYITRNDRVLAIARINNKVFVHVAADERAAEAGLLAKIESPLYALYDMDAPTSHHNSSVRTRA